MVAAILYFFIIIAHTTTTAAAAVKVHHVKHELNCSSAVSSALYEKNALDRGSNNQFSFLKSS